MTVCLLTCLFEVNRVQVKYVTSSACNGEINKEAILKRFVRDHKISEKQRANVKLLSYELGNKIGL